jgi:putative sigma-54 modulation protein
VQTGLPVDSFLTLLDRNTTAFWQSLKAGHRLCINPLRSKEAGMNLTISGHHLEVTPSLREYVLTKLERVMRHFDQVVDVTVLLSVEKQKEKDRRQRAEINVHVKGKDIFVENAHEDLYAAIDQLMDKLDRQVCRYKDKVQDHQHTSLKRQGETFWEAPNPQSL